LTFCIGVLNLPPCNQGSLFDVFRIGISIGLFAFVTSFFWAVPAAANPYVCPAQLGPGERFIGMSQAGPGVAAVPLCVQDGVASSPSQPVARPRPALDNFGAVVSSPHLNDVFFSQYLGSPEDAEREALRRCREVITQPGGCVFEMWVSNQHLAVAQRADGLRFFEASPLYAGAEQEALAACEKAGLRCRIIANFNALPIHAFSRPSPSGYSPSLSNEVQAAYATASWPIDGQSDFVWIARGYGSFAESDATAVSACASATGKVCQPQRRNSDTNFIVATEVLATQYRFVVNEAFEPTEAERAVRRICVEGAVCKLLQVVPARGPREVVAVPVIFDPKS
jgi:hypothetical protein